MAVHAQRERVTISPNCARRFVQVDLRVMRPQLHQGQIIGCDLRRQILGATGAERACAAHTRAATGARRRAAVGATRRVRIDPRVVSS